jgi:glycosyltransferase involved in cell wall biosynthesis
LSPGSDRTAKQGADPFSERRIAILLPDLRSGGAEQLHINLANEWIRRGFQVEFVLQQAKGELLVQLPEGATVIDLGVSRIRGIFRPLVRYLKGRQPDALLAAMWPLTIIAPLAARVAGYRGRVVVSEHNNMTAAYASRGRVHRATMDVSMRFGYPIATAVVGVSEGVVDDLVLRSGLPRDMFAVIYNPAATGVDASMNERPVFLVGRDLVILSVGTLKPQKRPDLLLAAFARIPASLGATLCFVGTGALRSDLERQAQDLGVEGRVIFAGFQADTATWYAHADLFVLASDYEGFGNVIVEALEQGLPVVSTDCPSGPREILAEGRFGALVPVGDANGLAAAIVESLSRPRDRNGLRARAREFSVDKAASAYLDLLLRGSSVTSWSSTSGI